MRKEPSDFLKDRIDFSIFEMEYDAHQIHENDFNKKTFQNLLYLCEKYWNRSKGRMLLGRNRAVFILNTDIVVKIPICVNGILDNDWEGSISNTDSNPTEVQYARTRLTYFRSIPIVFMEYIAYAGKKEIIRRRN